MLNYFVERAVIHCCVAERSSLRSHCEILINLTNFTTCLARLMPKSFCLDFDLNSSKYLLIMLLLLLVGCRLTLHQHNRLFAVAVDC